MVASTCILLRFALEVGAASLRRQFAVRQSICTAKCQKYWACQRNYMEIL